MRNTTFADLYFFHVHALADPFHKLSVYVIVGPCASLCYQE